MAECSILQVVLSLAVFISTSVMGDKNVDANSKWLKFSSNIISKWLWFGPTFAWID
jgi:hypothetical protein